MARPKRKISAARRDLSNREHILYRFWNAQDVLLYVGITVDSATRLADHMRDKPWWDEVETTKFTKFPTRSAALEAEAEMIRTLKPLYNVQHNEMVDDDDESSDPTHDLAVDVLACMFNNERNFYLADNSVDLDGNELSSMERDIRAASSGVSAIMFERISTERALHDYLNFLPRKTESDLHRRISRDADLVGPTELSLVIALFEEHVDDLARSYLSALHKDEAEEWRESARVGRVAERQIDRWAARYAALYKAKGWIPRGHCAGPGISGARCAHMAQATVFFELCPWCPAENLQCGGHARWCWKHTNAALYGRFQLLADDPAAAFPIASIVEGDVSDEAPF